MAPTTKQTIEPPDHFTGCYTMWFRHLTNHLQSKNFRCVGGLKVARERAEKHCTILGARLNFVQPLISDLSKEELYHLGRKGEEELA